MKKQNKGLLPNYSTPVITTKAKLLKKPNSQIKLPTIQTPIIKTKLKIPQYLQIQQQIKPIKRNLLAPITPQNKHASASPSSVNPVEQQPTFQNINNRNSNIFTRVQSSIESQSLSTTPVGSFAAPGFKRKESLSNPPPPVKQKFQIANVNMSGSYKSQLISSDKSKSKNRKKSNYYNSYNSEMMESEFVIPQKSRRPQRDPSRSQLNLYSLNRQKMLSECDHSLEFIIVAFCKAFGFQNPQVAAKFVAGGIHSEYAQSLKTIDNFSKINQFLSLLQTNLKTLIRILEAENDYQNVKYGEMIVQENSSQTKIMNLLAMSLSRSVDERIVWQTCNLLSGIFQNVNGIQINYGFQTMMIRWAMNQDEQGNFKGPESNDFIQSCLLARKNHQELNNVVIGLFIEVANMGRSKRKWERQNDNSQLVELFAVILPQYFQEDRENEYFDLMHDILESHHFQFEKERIDKQHLLFKMVDKCLYFLSLINEPQELSLENSVNTRQSCMSLICSIWSNNKQIFRHSIHKFIAHFVQLFKPDDKQVTNTLLFDYIEYEQQAKVGKIVLLLLKRNLKDNNKLIKITCFTQLSRLLELFTKREEIDLQNVVFKLIVLQMTDQFENIDLVDVREIVANFLAKYIKENEKANIDFVVNTLQKYGYQQIQKSANRQFPLFNTCDYNLIIQILKHPRTNQQVAMALYDLFFQIIFQEKFFEYPSMIFAQKFLYKLAVRFSTDLLIKWKQLIQLGCITIAKIERVNQQNQILKTYVIYQLILKIIRKTKSQNLKKFSLDFIEKFISSSKVLRSLSKAIDTTPYEDLYEKDSNESIRSRKIKSGALYSSKIPILDIGTNKVEEEKTNHTLTLKVIHMENNTNRNQIKVRKNIESISQFKAKGGYQDQETYRTGGGAVKSTQRFQIAGENQTDFNEDMVDQSSQTTLRTEIYTSEDEEEMMNYYTYLSTYKKKEPAELEKAKTFKSSKSEEVVKEESEKAQPVEAQEDVQVQSQLSQTKEFKRSNSLSQFQSSIKIMEEASSYLIRTKEQLARPEGENNKKSKKKRILLRRQSTHNLNLNQDQKKMQLQTSGGKTDRLMFKNKLCLKMNEQFSENAGATDRSIKMNQTIEKMGNSAKFSNDNKPVVMRVDPNSNYQLKSKYISQDPIMEESLEQSKQKLIKDNIPNNLPKVPRSMRSHKRKKETEDYSQYIHKTDQPNVMIISSRREAKEKETSPEKGQEKVQLKSKEKGKEQKNPENVPEKAQEKTQEKASKEKILIKDKEKAPQEKEEKKAETEPQAKKQPLIPPSLPTQALKPLLIEPKSQTSKPQLIKINSRRSFKSKQNEEVQVIEPKIIQSERLLEAPNSQAQKEPPVDSMNDRDESESPQAGIKMIDIPEPPVIQIQIQKQETKNSSVVVVSPHLHLPLKDIKSLEDSGVTITPSQSVAKVSVSLPEESITIAPTPDESGAKTPSQLRGEHLKKLFQTDEEEEKIKNRTIYAQQLIDLGIGSMDASTPQDWDNSGPNLSIQPIKCDKEGAKTPMENKKLNDFKDYINNDDINLPQVSTPVTNQSPDGSPKKFSHLQKKEPKPEMKPIQQQYPMLQQLVPGQQMTYQQFQAQMQYLRQLQLNLEMQLQQLQRYKSQQQLQQTPLQQYFSNSSFNNTKFQSNQKQSDTTPTSKKTALMRRKQFQMNQAKSQIIDSTVSPVPNLQKNPSYSNRSLISNFTANVHMQKEPTQRSISPLVASRVSNARDMIHTQVISMNTESQQKALKMRRKIKREFTETIKSIRISKQDIDTISYKASERIREMKEKKKLKDIANVSMYGQSEFGDIQIDQSISQNNLPNLRGDLTPNRSNQISTDFRQQYKSVIEEKNKSSISIQGSVSPHQMMPMNYPYQYQYGFPQQNPMQLSPQPQFQQNPSQFFPQPQYAPGPQFQQQNQAINPQFQQAQQMQFPQQYYYPHVPPQQFYPQGHMYPVYPQMQQFQQPMEQQKMQQ